MKRMIIGYALVISSALIYGLMPLLAKFIYAEGVTPLSLVLLRNAFALLVVMIFAGASGTDLKVSPKLLPKICIIGLMCSCVTPLLLFSSYSFIPSGSATVLHFIYPAVVVLGEFMFLKSKLKCGHVISVIICVAGIALFYSPESKLNAEGSLLAILSGITYASYIVSLSAFKHRKIPSVTFNFYTYLATTVIMIPVCIFTSQLKLPVSVTGWLLSAVFGFLVGFGAVILFQKGTFIIGGSKAAILSTLEPITSVIAGVLILGEPMSFLTFAGIVLVIAAGIIITVSDTKKSS